MLWRLKIFFYTLLVFSILRVYQCIFCSSEEEDCWWSGFSQYPFLESSAYDETIKKHYRRLAQALHRDKIVYVRGKRCLRLYLEQVGCCMIEQKEWHMIISMDHLLHAWSILHHKKLSIDWTGRLVWRKAICSLKLIHVFFHVQFPILVQKFIG